MKRIVWGSLRVMARALGYGLIGALVVLVAGLVLFTNRHPDLSVWHTADLDAEFTAASGIENFEAYLALEDRLFRQLDERVHARIEPRQATQLNRYHAGSLADPHRWPRNWNRSYVLPVDSPRAGALLIHGLSDSPYSLRNQAEALHRAGVFVVGLRVPGHGTAPLGLVHTRWEDMAGAVRLAATYLAERVGDQPLFLLGYSNGGALAIDYALTGLSDATLRRAAAIVLFSPAIGISPVAALAVWQERIGRLLGLEKLAWSSVGPEYDPFKYQSFAVNAGNQSHRLTTEIARLLDRQDGAGLLEDFPPVLVFQSAVDATVSTPAVIEGLLARLPSRGHELVLFDLNRMTEIEYLLTFDPKDELRALLDRDDLPFTLRVVTNESETTPVVVLRSIEAGQTEIEESTLQERWPGDVFSLSHVAVPFPPWDPLYGDGRGEPSPGIHLGQIAIRGERGVLQVSATAMLRAVSNPFYGFLESRMLGFLGLADEADLHGPVAARPASTALASPAAARTPRATSARSLAR